MKVAFRFKLFIFCVVIILSTSIPIAISTYKYMYNWLKSSIELDSKKQMEAIDTSIFSTIYEIKKDAKILGNSKDITQINNFILDSSDVSKNEINNNNLDMRSSIYRNFEIYGTTHGQVEDLCFGTKWGEYVRWPNNFVNSNFDPRQSNWYSIAMNNPDKAIMSEPYDIIVENNQTIVVSICTTVRNDKGDIIGVLTINTNLNKFSKIINNIKFGNSGYTFLYLNDGTVLAHPNADLNFKNISSLKKSDFKETDSDGLYFKDANKLLDTENDLFETIVDGNEVFINVYTSPYTGWKMASVIPKSQFTNKINEIEKIIFGITICILVFGISLTYIVVQNITKPIKKLNPLMHLAGSGDFSVRADIKTNDEFEELSDSFNLMMCKLSASQDDLSAVYEELVATEEEIRTQYEEIQQSQESLRNSEERYKLALECANDSIWEWDLYSNKFFISDRLVDIIGYKLKIVDNMAEIVRELIHKEDLQKFKEDLQNHIDCRSTSLNIECRIKTKDGSYTWILCKGKAIRNSNGEAIKVTGSVSDISKRKIAEDKIKFMAYYDMLTKLPNKVLFIEEMNRQLMWEENQDSHGAVLFIDLDNFKNINDLMGHKYGDELLIYLSGQFKNLIGDKSKIYRSGGDEFIILNTSINEDKIEEYVNRILSVFDRSVELNNKQVSITASIGVAFYPKDGLDCDTIMKNADSAMYKAKEQGKNRFALYNPEIYLKLERKITIERILRQAIENNELSINYQPQYDAIKNEIFGFEALVRLNSKELGLISPTEFIPIAEECGYITQISLWVFKESCLQSAKLFNEGCKFRSMSVNISSVDLNKKDFINNISKIIKETNIDPNIIELEITETVLMQSLETSINALNQLRGLGIRIALDDFGTGYSSLNYLRKMPINTLKIDKSFIDNITLNSKEESIINNIIQMAHTMDLKVVAEGVETKDQLAILKDKKCNFIQGYYFSKPLPANELTKLFPNSKKVG